MTTKFHDIKKMDAEWQMRSTTNAGMMGVLVCACVVALYYRELEYVVGLCTMATVPWSLQ